MKIKLLLSLLLAAALCFYGCEDKQLDEPQDVPVIVDPTDEPENSDEGDGNGSQGDENTSTDEDEDDAEADEVDPWYLEPGDGTKDSPYSVPQIREMTDDEIFNINWCYVKGIVAHLAGAISVPDEEGYTFNYYISEDGKGYEEGICLFVPAGTALGGEKFATFSDLNLGDKVIVYGGLVRGDWWGLTNGTLYYWNGEFAENQDDDGGDDNGDDGDDDDNGDDNGDDDEPEVDDPNDVCTYMNDDGFKQYCRDNFDLDGDRKVSFDEAEKVTVINCSTAEDFTGIEYFTNLQSFTSVSAKYLDLSENTLLTYINLSNCTIYGNGSVGVPANPAAPIETLDLSHNVNLTEIPEGAFCYCTNLASITLPETVNSVEGYAFNRCTSLSSIVLPDGLISIGERAFNYCSELTYVSLPESLVSIEQGAFEAAGLTSVSLPSKITVIEDGSFNGCSSLTSISFPENLTSIGIRAFQGCSSLTAVSLPDKLTSIGDSAFSACISLTSVSLPKSLISMGGSAFNWCLKLESIDMSGTGLTTIEKSSFYLCEKLQYVVFPDSLTSIGESAFESCSSLIGCKSSTDFTIPENVVTIGDSAFKDCSKLARATLLSEGLTEIGEEAFNGCSKLQDVWVYAPDPPALGASAFPTLSSQQRLYVPWSSYNLYCNHSDFPLYFDYISTISN